MKELETEALEASQSTSKKDAPSVDFINRLNMVKLTAKSSLVDVKRNILLIQRILSDLSLISSKGYVNTSDILTKVKSAFISKCSSGLLIYSYTRVLPQGEFRYWEKKLDSKTRLELLK